MPVASAIFFEGTPNPPGTMDSDLDEPVPVKRLWPGPKTFFSWSILLLVGWLLFEVTAWPALGAVTACLKFGWEDFQTGRWLRRRDPNRRRGSACFWLCLGSALWKIAVTASALMLVYAVLSGGGPPPVMGQFEAAGTTAFAAFGLSALATTVALWKAWRERLKLWLDPSMHGCRRRDCWPPYSARWTAPNRADRIVFIAEIYVFVLALLAAILVAVYFMQQLVGGGAVLGLILFLAGLASSIIGGPVILLRLRDVLDRRVLAVTPVECWGTSGSCGDKDA